MKRDEAISRLQQHEADLKRLALNISTCSARSPLLSDAIWLDAFRQGWITPPVLIGREPPARKPVMKIDELLSCLQHDRADR